MHLVVSSTTGVELVFEGSPDLHFHELFDTLHIEGAPRLVDLSTGKSLETQDRDASLASAGLVDGAKLLVVPRRPQRTNPSPCTSIPSGTAIQQATAHFHRRLTGDDEADGLMQESGARKNFPLLLQGLVQALVVIGKMMTQLEFRDQNEHRGDTDEMIDEALEGLDEEYSFLEDEVDDDVQLIGDRSHASTSAEPVAEGPTTISAEATEQHEAEEVEEEEEEEEEEDIGEFNSEILPSDEDLEAMIDAGAIEVLCSAGFPRALCVKALILNADTSAAMMWLLEVEDTSDESAAVIADSERLAFAMGQHEERVQAQRERHAQRARRRHRAVSGGAASGGAQAEEGGEEESPLEVGVRSLVDMGFDAEDARRVLRACRNDTQQAALWLLEGRAIPQMQMDADDEGDDADDGDDGDADEEQLDAPFPKDLARLIEDPRVRAVLADARVQMCITSKRAIQALEQLLQQPTAIGQFLSHPEVGPILEQISRVVQMDFS